MSTAGITKDRPFIYGKQFTFLHVQWTIGATGAVATVKGAGFGSSTARPHRGSVVRTDTGDYTVTIPGDGGAIKLMTVLALEHVVAGTALTNSYVIDLTDGTLDITFDSSGTPTDPDSGDEVHLTLMVSDWPHFD